jgi:hypothetical protein
MGDEKRMSKRTTKGLSVQAETTNNQTEIKSNIILSMISLNRKEAGIAE